MTSPLVIHIGYQRCLNRYKLTTDVDCLSPDISNYTVRTASDHEQLMRCAKALEVEGYLVCVDTGDLFYESDTQKRR